MIRDFFTKRWCRLGQHNWWYVPREGKPPVRYCLRCDARETAHYDELAKRTFWAYGEAKPQSSLRNKQSRNPDSGNYSHGSA